MEKASSLLGIPVDQLPSLEPLDKGEKEREAQSILLFIEKPDAFRRKICDNCHETFLTTYLYVSVCSDRCRRVSLEKIGITWNPNNTPEERWKRAGIPIEYSIPPKALEILLAIAQEQTEVECETPEKESPPDDVDELLSELGL